MRNILLLYKTRVIFIYRHLLTIYYIDGHLLLPTHFVVAKIMCALQKGKPDEGIFVTRITILVTLVYCFEIRNCSTAIDEF